MPRSVFEKCSCAASANLIQPTNGWPTIGAALNVVSTAITRLLQQLAKEQDRQWRQQFSAWSKALWKAAGPVLHEVNDAPSFTANDMREAWARIWRNPTRVGGPFLQAWLAYASQVSFPERSKPRFEKALLAASGAAGYDGWSSEEVKFLTRHCPQPARELCSLSGLIRPGSWL